MDEFLINTTTSGNQGQPSVCGLQGTQFVVAWEDRGDGTIKAQMYGSGGVASSSRRRRARGGNCLTSSSSAPALSWPGPSRPPAARQRRRPS